jgi:uncharacterized protein (DUF2252 family)
MRLVEHMATITPTTQPSSSRGTFPSVSERIARGHGTRSIVPRSALGTWAPSPGRPDPVGVLEEHATTRVAELIPIRYGRMVASPFAFYRGAAAIMAADLADSPRTGLDVQLCGDAHLSNFGAFAAPDRRLVFSINDFDESLPGPFEWDVKRLVASLAVAGREQTFPPDKRRAIEVAGAQSYRKAMQSFAAMGTLDLWYTRLDVDEMLRRWGADAAASDLRNFRRARKKAESRDSLRAMAKLTRIVDGRPQFVSDPPIVVRLDDLFGADEATRFAEQVGELLESYTSTLSPERRRLVERFHFADIARKVVGVGSVGTRAWVVLMLGRDNDDPLLLQFKEAQPSVLERYLGASVYDHHGRRVVEGQRLMQAATDVLLGWQRTTGPDGVQRDFYVRQLWDRKGSAAVELMTPRAMRLYASACGWTLARAHARSGDPVAIAAYLGSGTTFDRTMADFAESYADQNERDHAALEAAIASGLVHATSGV